MLIVDDHDHSGGKVGFNDDDGVDGDGDGGKVRCNFDDFDDGVLMVS